MEDLYIKYEAALREIERLKEENSKLKKQLGYEEPKGESPSGVHQLSSVEEKLALYRSLFRGREDVYPVRWHNKQGKSGYSPACGNEWTAVCQKPKVKCSVCMHQQYLPVTDDVLSRHLDAREDRTIGVYPMLHDETCWFLAMDFDKKNWQEDAAAVIGVCREKGIPAALERSRSGNGGHIWIFFEEAISAQLARRLGTIILTLTMKQRYQLGLDSYDRLFPNQDTMPKGGFGNLIALPLQGGPRKQGNSVFVDAKLAPYEDQWSFLSGLGKLSEDHVVRFIQQNAREDQTVSILTEATDEVTEPWDVDSKPPEPALVQHLPSEIEVVLADRVYVDKNGLPSAALNRLIRLASFSNPDFFKTQAMRLSTYGKPRVICCAEDLSSHMALPRGCLSAVEGFFKEHGSHVQLEDRRTHGQPIEAEFTGELTTLQDAAARAIVAHDIGILSAATGFGKTVVAASIIARRKVNTLIIVHRRELMDQWKERLEAFLELPPSSIGVVGGGKDKRGGIVDIAIIQSLNHKGEVKPFIEEYGQIIVDECHHLSAFSFEQVLMKAKAKYVFGLTATPKRQDGQEAIVLMQLGPIRMKVDAKMLTGSRGFSLTVVPRYTSFRMPPEKSSSTIQEVYQHLVEDEARNTMIFDDLLHCLDEGRSPLLLVERTSHVDYFEERLRSFAKNVIVLRGGMGKKQREAVREKIASIPDDEERVFIATGKLIGEGFDDARLDTLFLVHPISWTGTLQQYAGRLHRSHVNKREVKIYDYIDLQVPMLMSMYKKRVKGYRKMGYRGAEI
ncbi:TOTE conflict system archaeo-eukaryotic primase domain-containing protein [Paenibacillus soyae]|uniref:DEAD/DEAH box helicase n=1 Tax=Paenibacillus soyae TaxID=2969249 RepID=A0A9X2S897_9BACL|nr:DEAD/DEAH box helicase [Paenibacillus soyae]MCR2803990.1 DEAD/DEAH box helicase [Paenibacillus soyae]